MKIYFTEYRISEDIYASQVIAVSKEEAEKIIEGRGLDEKIVGSREINSSDAYDLLHTVCFLGWIALRTGKASPDDILSDKGVLHEAIHLFSGSYDGTIESFNDRLAWLYKITGSGTCVPVFAGIFNTV